MKMNCFYQPREGKFNAQAEGPAAAELPGLQAVEGSPQQNISHDNRFFERLFLNSTVGEINTLAIKFLWCTQRP